MMPIYTSIMRTMLIASIFGCQGLAYAAPASDLAPFLPSGSNETDPFCGVACLYAASHILGVDVPFQAVTHPRYISSSQGSSMQDLASAAKDIGIDAIAMQDMNWSMLVASNYPVLLHVKSRAESVKYDHFVLWLQPDGDDYGLILDPPRAVTRISRGELASRWHGSGMVVGREVDLSRMRLAGYKRIGLQIACILAAALVLRYAARLRARRIQFSSLFSFPALCVSVLVGASIYHAFSATGLMRDGRWRAVAEGRLAVFLPRVSAWEIEDHAAMGAILVDARMPRDYAAGTIPGSINYPVDAAHSPIGDVSKAKTIIVFCQSLACPFDDEIASRLTRDGFKHVMIFPGGWKEYVTYSKQKHGQ